MKQKLMLCRDFIGEQGLRNVCACLLNENGQSIGICDFEGEEVRRLIAIDSVDHAQFLRDAIKLRDSRDDSSKPFQPDEMVWMFTPYMDEPEQVSYRGPLGEKSVVWTGRMQMSIPTEWLSRQKQTKVEK